VSNIVLVGHVSSVRMPMTYMDYSPLFCLRPLAEDRRLVLDFPERYGVSQQDFNFIR